MDFFSISACTWCVSSSILASTFFAISVIPGVRFFTKVTSSSILSTISATDKYSRTPRQTFRIFRTSASSNVSSNADVPERMPEIIRLNIKRTRIYNYSSFPCSRVHIYVVVQFYPWFKFSFLLFQTHYHVIIIHYHTQKQKKRKFEPKIKLNHNIYTYRSKLYSG